MTTSGGFDPRRYWESRLQDRYSLAGVGHHRLGERFNGWQYRVKAHVFDALVRSHVSNVRGAKVLEVGPGTGFYVSRWLVQGASVTGLDIADVAVEALGDRFPAARFLQGDIGLPLAEPLASELGTFDIVCAMDVLYHVVDDALFETALHNLARLLKPGGHFVWSDVFLHGAEVRTTHAVSRTLASVERLLHGAGLRPVVRRPMAVLMNYPIDTRWRIVPLLWKAAMSPAVVSDFVGGVLGAALYLPERYLVTRLLEGPSTEIMLCVNEPGPGRDRRAP